MSLERIYPMSGVRPTNISTINVLISIANPSAIGRYSVPIRDGWLVVNGSFSSRSFCLAYV